MKKLLLALLPAILAHLGMYAVGFFENLNDHGYIIWILLGLLVLGGILAASFVGGALRRRNPPPNMFLVGFVWLIIFISYIAAFSFTGCLLAISQEA